MDEQAKNLKMDALSGEILLLARASLLLHLRFMESAIGRLSFEPFPKGTLATDGRRFLYSPMHVLLRYKTEQNAPARDLLHCVLHCVFRHMYLHRKVDRRAWSLACDMSVENLIADLGVRAAVTERQSAQKEALDALRSRVKPLTAEKLYRHFLDQPPAEEEFQRLEELFRADDHSAWFPNDEDDDKEQNERDEDSPDLPQPNAPPMETEQEWKEVAESIEADMETLSREAGDLAGETLKALRAVNREKHDYAAFLKKFAVRGEVLKLDPDEFDYIYYTYGLKLYGNVPLIEPLEYREEERIRSFVIAIDTSGSVADELVYAFLQKTYNILKSTESFFRRVEIRILQCDTEIRDDVRVTNLKELDAYLKRMTLHGFGGTDFRPVFRYVDELRQGGELTKLRGLIYFTDGIGRFPEKKPDYDTAFVFVEDGENQYDVPVWAMKLVLEQEELL
jgi:predicted metal-dependent peptidase